MISTPYLIKNKFEYLELPTQIDSSEIFSVNHVLTHVTQIVADKFQQTYSTQVNRSNFIQTVSIRALRSGLAH
jgi:hypothetical protein